MPNINLSDERKRDAVVKAENIRIDEPSVDAEIPLTWTGKMFQPTRR